jgi:hypothetical protein
MKKLITVAGIVLLAGFIAYPVFAHGPGWGRGHRMGSWGGGSGSCWDYQRGYGSGSGDRTYSYREDTRLRGSNNLFDEKEARTLIEDYVLSTGNPNIKLGGIEDKGNSFEAEILTKNGDLVDKIAMDKSTGWMRSIY